MKRPEKIVIWLPVERKRSDSLLDHNGKPDITCFIQLPYWLRKAFNPFFVKVEIRQKNPCFADMKKEENREEFMRYFRENWSKKVTKRIKLNHGFLRVAVMGKGRGFFKTVADYENYHKELADLNKKYGIS